MAFMFLPLYIKFMGVEAYGLVGIYASLQVLSGLLDMGLSGTLNREMARLSIFPGREQQMRNLVRSLEMIYWGIARPLKKAKIPLVIKFGQIFQKKTEDENQTYHCWLSN